MKRKKLLALVLCLAAWLCLATRSAAQNGYTTDQPKITLTTSGLEPINENPAAAWWFAIYANEPDIKKIWVDVNNNGQYEKGEEVPKLGAWIFFLPADGINTVTVYGPVREIFCNENNLTKVDISTNPGLVNLYAYKNKLKSIDLTQNPALEELCLYNNELTEVDVRQCKKLTKLRLEDNPIKTIDVSQNTKLNQLTIYNSDLESIDLSVLKDLKDINLSNTKLAAIDLSHNTELKYVDLTNNRIQKIDFSNNPKITYLEVANNKLSTVDLSPVPTLEYFDAEHNQLSTLDISTNKKLHTLHLKGNKLQTLDMDADCGLINLFLQENEINKLDLSHKVNLRQLFLQHNNLESIDLSKCSEMMRLNLSYNPIQEVDFTGLTQLDVLYLNGMKIKEFDIRPLKRLQRLFIYYNELKGEGLTNSMYTLPLRNPISKGELYILNTPREGDPTPPIQEGNKVLAYDARIAGARGWYVFDYQNGYRDGTNVYEGLPETLVGLELAAFADCDKLQEIWLPGNTQLIEDRAFEDCDALRVVVIKEGLPKYFGRLAFPENEGMVIYLGDPAALERVQRQYPFELTQVKPFSEYTPAQQPTDQEELAIAIVPSGLHLTAISQETIAIYSVDGRCLEQRTLDAGETCLITLAAGEYILRNNHNTTKVIIAE